MNTPNILLINPPQNLDAVLGSGKHLVQKYEPLGLLYIASVLHMHGYHVTILDAFAENLSEEALKTKILQSNPTHIGISTLTCNGGVVYRLGRWLKTTLPQATVILGNIHASVFAELYLSQHACDIVVHGEGEYIMLALMEAYKNNIDLASLPGISFLAKTGKVATTQRAPLPRNLDAIPFPLREGVHQELYVLSSLSNQVFAGKNSRTAKSVMSSRGCNHRCTFCVVNPHQSQRFRSAENVVAELEHLQAAYHTSFVTFMDSLFMADKKRVIEICRLMKHKGLKMQWVCDAHVNYISPELVEEMASAGCFELDFGIESGVQRLLDGVCKGTTLEGIRQAVATVKTHSSIKIGGLFILGLPGETEHDSLQTIAFAKNLPLDMAQFTICTPYPGSALFNTLSKQGKIDTGARNDGSVDTSIWDRYSAYISFSAVEPIWVTEGLSSEDLRRLQKKAHREFYLRLPHILKNLTRLNLSTLGAAIKILWKGFF